VALLFVIADAQKTHGYEHFNW